jgi:hypothetical protein
VANDCSRGAPATVADGDADRDADRARRKRIWENRCDNGAFQRRPRDGAIPGHTGAANFRCCSWVGSAPRRWRRSGACAPVPVRCPLSVAGSKNEVPCRSEDSVSEGALIFHAVRTRSCWHYTPSAGITAARIRPRSDPQAMRGRPPGRIVTP